MRSLFLMIATLLVSGFAKAQTNAQVLYDFGTDRKFVTLTLEMFKQDKWGNTYFFVDHDFNLNQMTDPNTGKDPCPCGSGKKYKQCCGRKVV